MVGFTEKERKHGEAALSGVRPRPYAPSLHGNCRALGWLTCATTPLLLLRR